MNKNTLHTCLTAGLLVALASGPAQAELIDRGGGMIYDSSLNITWLQDANFALTSGDNTGLRGDGAFSSWRLAKDWAGGLVYGGYSDWRLPSAHLIGNDSASYDGSSDLGFNNRRSELGHLFLELGNKAAFDTTGRAQPGAGMLNTSFVDARTGQVVGFHNVQVVYWTLESYAGNPSSAWAFTTTQGRQFYFSNTATTIFAWAVRDGDVSPVPEPSSWALMMGGLLFTCARCTALPSGLRKASGRFRARRSPGRR